MKNHRPSRVNLVSLRSRHDGQEVPGTELMSIPEAIAAAERWVDLAEQPVDRGGQVSRWLPWPDQPDFTSFYGPYSLNTGAAGIAWHAMYSWLVTNNTSHQDRAFRALNLLVNSPSEILQHRPFPMPLSEHGYYGGLAGVGAVLARAAELWPERYRAAALTSLDELLAAQRSPGVWTGNYSLLGDAGIALAVAYSGKALKHQTYLDTLSHFGETLLRAQLPGDQGWPGTDLRTLGAAMDGQLHGFELGNEGIAYTLAQLGETLSDERYIAAAEQAIAPVLQSAEQVGELLIVKRFDGSVFLGYCTGIAGVIRSVVKLFQITGKPEYLTTATALGKTIVASTTAGRFTPSNEFVYHQCCGTAGRLEALTGMYRVTGDAWWLEAGESQAEQLLTHGVNDEQGLRWYSRAERLPKGTLKAEIGHQAGSSGIMLALERFQHARDTAEHPQTTIDHRLPDDPFE